MDKLIKLVAMTNTQVGELMKQTTTASTIQPAVPVAQPVQPSTATKGSEK